MIRDSIAKNKEIKKPTIPLPMRKKLSSIGMSAVDIRAKVEEDS